MVDAGGESIVSPAATPRWAHVAHDASLSPKVARFEPLVSSPIRRSASTRRISSRS